MYKNQSDIYGKPRADLVLVSNDSGNILAQEVLEELGKKDLYNNLSLSGLEERKFANGERVPILEDTARGRDAFVITQIQDPTSPRSVDDNLAVHKQTIRTLRTAGANYVTSIIPFHPYSRQDKTTGREPISMRLIAEEITNAGASNVLTFDLHNQATTGFYDPTQTKIDNLKGSKVFIPDIKELIRKDPSSYMIVAPDTGAAKRAEFYAGELGINMAFGYKQRDQNSPNKVDNLEILGDVFGKKLIILDDMVDTGGTIEKLVQRAREQNCEDIHFYTTHAILPNEKSLSRMRNLEIKLITTDTIPRDMIFLEQNSKWFRQISVAPNIAAAVYALNTNQSLKNVYEES